jgi:hypothetical protein
VHCRSADGRLPPASAVVFSSGHHTPLPQLARAWADVEARDALFRVARARGVRLILQQYEQQHFAGGRGDFEAVRHRGAAAPRTCEPLIPDADPDGAASAHNRSVPAIERELVIPHLLAHGFEVLETHAISRAAWWGHTHAAPTPSHTADCTHFCMPGVPDVWAGMLADVMLSRP